MEYQFSFERLEVWKDARILVKNIYLLAGSFPKSELYSLTNQMQRATVSVVSNLAEGMGRISLKEESHFCQIAYGSDGSICTAIVSP